MDACFEILVETFRPPSDMERLRHVASWGGEEHVQRPDSFRWGDLVELKPLVEPIPSFVTARMPSDLRGRTWERIRLDGDLLDQLAFEATGGEIEWADRSPDELFTRLLDDRESWVVLFLWHWDQLDEVVELDANELASKLREGFASRPKGFLAVHRGKRVHD